MIRRVNYLFVKALYIAIDVVCIYSALFFAATIRTRTLPFEVTVSNILFEPTNPFRYLFAFWIVVTIFFLNANRLYETRREMLEGFEIGKVFQSVISSAVVVIVAIFALKIEGFPRTVFTIGIVFGIIILSVWRVIKRQFVEYLVQHGYNNVNVLIIGAGKIGTELAGEIRKRPGLGMRIIGYLDDFKKGTVDTHQARVLGPVADFERIVRTEFINEIFITIHPDTNWFLSILEKARALGVAVRVVPHGFEFITGELVKYNIGIIPVMQYSAARGSTRQVGKRLFDFVLASALVLFLSPVFVALAIAIKFDSVGPVFYSAQRYGRGGRRFRMYKFRSMVVDADALLEKYRPHNEADGPIFKMKKDPRITRMGRFLRRYSFDELPQILNVIKGDMSLVGPRPLPIDQVEKEDLQQLKRLEVRPGITGLWQIRGRSDISFRRLIRWDMWYIDNWSFWLDLNILLKTVPVVIRGKGAY